MKIKWGALVVEGRGKLNGNVASRNRAGAYLRTKVTPVNPQTSAQSSVRNRLAGLSQGWSSLTAAQRDAWNSVVSDFAKTDIFGDLKNPSGFNLFCKLNANLLNVGESQISTPPMVESVFALDELSIEAESGTQSLTVTFSGAIPATDKVIVFATPPLSCGKNFVKSEYRQIAVLDDSDTSPYDALTDYQNKFGSTGEEGQKIFVKCVAVNITSGQKGSPLSASVIVEASA
jgi:hypothetical protein